MIVLIILAFIIMLAINLPSLIKSRDYKLIIIYGCFYTASFALSLLLAMNVKLPSILEMADSLFKTLKLSY
ncbi:MAG TPA: hypothetical protein GXX54_03640 [Clostridiales bacterium]|nr:hypothetical protein [Clostridiales bacterium]